MYSSSTVKLREVYEFIYIGIFRLLITDVLPKVTIQNTVDDMDDSKAALIKAYNTIRERYNKLRNDYRVLVKRRTCSRCQQHLEMQPTSESGPKSSKEAEEIMETCEKLKQLVEVGKSLNDSCTVGSIVANLEEIAGRLSVNLASGSPIKPAGDITAYSVSTSNIPLESNSAMFSCSECENDATCCASAEPEVLPDVIGDGTDDADHEEVGLQTEDLCLSEGDSPWHSDLQDATNLATSQYQELKLVCDNLQRQNEILNRLMKQLLSKKNDQDQYIGTSADGDWSLLVLNGQETLSK